MPRYISGEESNRAKFHKEGNYLAAVIGAEEKTSSSGNEMIELKLEIIGPDIDEGGGAIVYDYLVFSQNAAWKIDQFRAACGEKIIKGKEVEIEASDLEGKSVEVHLIVEDFKGKKQNKVGDYIDPNAEEDEPNPF